MSLPRSCRPVAAAACLAAGAVGAAWAQEPPQLPAAQADPPMEQHAPPEVRTAPTQDQGARTRMTESVRRYGRENRGGRVLGVESIRLNNRNLNRVKTVDERGRVRVRIDDPQQSPSSAPPPAPPPWGCQTRTSNAIPMACRTFWRDRACDCLVLRIHDMHQ